MVVQNLPNMRCPVCDRTISVDELESHINLRHPEVYKKTVKKIPTNIDRSKKRREIVVDGNNIAYISDNSQPCFLNLYRIRKILLKSNYNPKIIISARLKYVIDDPVKLSLWIREGKVLEAESGIDDDLEVILLAERLNTSIVTNDRYLNYLEEFPWIPRRLLKVELVDSKFRIIRPKYT